MKLKGNILRKLKSLDIYLDKKLENVSFPGFKGKSIYQVGKFFVNGLFQEDLSLVASSLAFNFFLAIFPLIIFLFTLIPYLPIDDLQGRITDMIEVFLPGNAFAFLNETITDIISNQNAGLLSFGFIAALYFASNGFATMMSAFDMGVDRKMQRSWLDIRIKSSAILFLVVSLLITTVLVSVVFTYSFEYLKDTTSLNDRFFRLFLAGFEYFLTILLVYLIFSSLYYFGSSKNAKWRFFSAGSTLGTILSLVTTYGFSKYVEGFNSYNKLYGSVGTLMVIMVLIFFNCFVVLIGFKLNKSIDEAS